MQKNTEFSLFLIILIAFLFRFSGLDKPEGLWNDEYTAWYIASVSDPIIFIKKVAASLHTPLYFLYLKLWMFLFSDSDLSLRISSAIPSILSIPVMYYAGKEIKDNKTGLFTALLTAISSFNIYFAHETRPYSLIFLVSAISILFFAKSFKTPKRLNLITFFVSCFILCTLHTLGIIFSLVLIFFYVLSTRKANEDKKRGLIYICIGVFLFLLLFLAPLLFMTAFKNTISQFWSTFSFSKILFCLTDYFSPVQLNIINTPGSFFAPGKTEYNAVFCIFAVIPAVISVYAIYETYKQKIIVYNLLFLSAMLFFAVLIMFSALGKMVLITKYSVEIYPVLIIGIAAGLLSVKKASLKKILISIIVFLNIFYLFVFPDAVHKRHVKEGHRLVALLLENSGLKPSDHVLLTYYDTDKFKKYLKSENEFNFHSINKFNFNYAVFDNPDFADVIKNGKETYRKEIKYFPNDKIIEYTRNNITNKMKKGDKLGVIFLKSVSFYSPDNIINFVNDDKIYKKIPFIFLVFSSLKHNIMYALKDDFKETAIIEEGDWMLIIYEKIR